MAWQDCVSGEAVDGATDLGQTVGTEISIHVLRTPPNSLAVIIGRANTLHMIPPKAHAPYQPLKSASKAARGVIPTWTAFPTTCISVAVLTETP